MSWDWLSKAHELQEAGATFALVTIIEQKGSAPRAPGAKMIVTPTAFHGTVGGGQLETKVIGDARQALAEAMALTAPYPLCFKTGQCCGGSVEALYEIIGAGPSLHVFGAGHVGQAVARAFIGTPFTVCLHDERPEWLNHEAIPAQVKRNGEDWRAYVDSVNWGARATYAVVMTHSHALDEDIIAALVTKPCRYIGLIGSATKWQRFRHRLKSRGIAEELINRVHCPIGLPVGGKAPQEIALSLGADLLRRHHLEAAASEPCIS